MEEDKIIKNMKEQLLPQGEQLLPIANPDYSSSKEKSGGAKIQLPGRISNVLTGNMIITPRSLEKKFNEEHSIEELLPKGSIDREGNIVKLSAMQNRVIFSLSKQIFSKDRKEVTEYMEAIKRGENPKSLPRMYVVLPSMSEDIFGEERRKEAIKLPELNGTLFGEGSGGLITLSDMSGDVFGEEEKGKPSKVKDIYSELESIARIKIPQVYPIGEFKDENGVVHKAAIRDLIPYITITGYERQLLIDDKVFSAIEIEPSRIFYEKNWVGKESRSFLLGKDILGARLPSGRKIVTDVYWCGLFPLAANYSWYYYYYRLEAVKKQIKKENIIDSEKIAQLKEDALTCTPIPFQRIREAINFKSKHPQEEARFKKQLWEGLWALIDRGVITEKSSINWDKETFTLVFSESREPLNRIGTRKEEERRPSGEWAEYAPKRKRRAKNSTKKEEKASPEQQELFSEIV